MLQKSYICKWAKMARIEISQAALGFFTGGLQEVHTLDRHLIPTTKNSIILFINKTSSETYYDFLIVIILYGQALVQGSV